jgi:hypothetical protein
MQESIKSMTLLLPLIRVFEFLLHVWSSQICVDNYGCGRWSFLLRVEHEAEAHTCPTYHRPNPYCLRRTDLVLKWNQIGARQYNPRTTTYRVIRAPGNHREQELDELLKRLDFGWCSSESYELAFRERLVVEESTWSIREQSWLPHISQPIRFVPHGREFVSNVGFERQQSFGIWRVF